MDKRPDPAGQSRLGRRLDPDSEEHRRGKRRCKALREESRLGAAESSRQRSIVEICRPQRGHLANRSEQQTNGGTWDYRADLGNVEENLADGWQRPAMDRTPWQQLAQDPDLPPHARLGYWLRWMGSAARGQLDEGRPVEDVRRDYWQFWEVLRATELTPDQLSDPEIGWIIRREKPSLLRPSSLKEIPPTQEGISD